MSNLVPTATEARVRRALMRWAGEQRLPLSVPQVHQMARVAARAADVGRPKDAQAPGRPANGDLAGLDAGHVAVLRGMAEHLSNGEIGEQLDMTKYQVEHRIRRLYGVFGQSTRSGLVAAGRRAGLLPDPKLPAG